MKKLLCQLLNGLFFCFSGCFFPALFVFGITEMTLPNVNVLKAFDYEEPLRVYTCDRKLIAEFGHIRRQPVGIDQIPKRLIQATVATEDQRFYSHEGVDWRGLLRAAAVLIRTGEKKQGGSTITMQVARNFFLSRKKTFYRKFREILLAIKIERTFDKDKILELYFNKVFYGQRAYGAAAAAKVYYNKKLSQLTLPQFAMLAGLPNAPSLLNPLTDPRAAIKRRNHVLTRMSDLHEIDRADYQAALKAPITAKYHKLKPTVFAPYAAEMVRRAVIERYGEEAYTAGLNVYTTLDSRRQKTARAAVRVGLAAYRRRYNWNQTRPQAALISINSYNGAILAVVGGANFKKSSFNRAVQMARPGGAVLTPFVYAAALEKNLIERVDIDDIASSFLLQQVGMPFMTQYLIRFGFQPRQLIYAFGKIAVSPEQLAAAYAVFTNSGYLIEPYVIDSIEKGNGQVIYSANPLVSKKFIRKKSAKIYTAPHVLAMNNAQAIRAALAISLDRALWGSSDWIEELNLFGKTGENDGKTEAWTVGGGQKEVASVWFGFDKPERIFGSVRETAAFIWLRFFERF